MTSSNWKQPLAFTLTACALAASAPAFAQVTSLNGMWLLKPADFARKREAPPLKPEVAAAAETARKKIDPNTAVLSDDNKKCLPQGMPGMMSNEFALEFLETPGRVTIISEDNPLVRTVYLNKKTHTEGIIPMWNGHSIGHWEGKTLVVDTVGLNDRKSHIDRNAPPSATTHIVERFTVSADGKTLTNVTTFEDPAVLAHPWTVTHSYDRQPADAELWEYACEVDAAGWSERFQGDPEAKITPKS